MNSVYDFNNFFYFIFCALPNLLVNDLKLNWKAPFSTWAMLNGSGLIQPGDNPKKFGLNLGETGNIFDERVKTNSGTK